MDKWNNEQGVMTSVITNREATVMACHQYRQTVRIWRPYHRMFSMSALVYINYWQQSPVL